MSEARSRSNKADRRREATGGRQPPRFRAARRQLLAESITEQLIAMISEGRIRPGEHLPSEHELMQQLKVGRSSVREALRGLALIGVVERSPRRGTVVVSPLPSLPTNMLKESIAQWALRDLFEARLLIEGFAAERAAELASDADLRRLERRAAAVEQKIRKGQGYFKENLAFHVTIVELARNTVLAHLHREVVGSLRDLRQKFETERDIEEHRQIVDAIKRRDAPGARRLIERHIAGVLNPSG